MLSGSELIQLVMPTKSGAWSPTLKKNLALATILAPHAKVGTTLRMEVTVESVRHTVAAVVSKRPFFDPPRKRA